MPHKTILVTGKHGQLGQSLKKLVEDCQTSVIASEAKQSIAEYEFVFSDREQLDLSSSESIAAFFIDNHFDVIINCAAYTAVDKAESEPELADQINHLAVKQLAEIAKAQNTIGNLE